MTSSSQVCEFDRIAVDFALPGTDGRTWRLADIRGPSGALVMFLCNHCPYVKGMIERLVADVGELREHGIGAAAIMSNDVAAYPEDSFDNMKRFAVERALNFPYLLDLDQTVARAYGASTTPEFFGFNREMRLQYHGRLDDAGKKGAPRRQRELFDAMVEIGRTGQGPRVQSPTVGCSIKWRRG